LARDWRVEGERQSAEVVYRGKVLGRIELQVLGKHNLLNALGALGVALSLGVTFADAAKGLAAFRHVRRRFDQRFYDPARSIRVIDDYGHHPTEVAAVLETARSTRPTRVVTVFQPHRFSRTQLCWKEFLTCFDLTDELLLLPIYAAGEDPIAGISAAELVRQLQVRSPERAAWIREVESLEAAAEWVQSHVQPGDLILTLGAGSVTKLAGMLAERLG
jgi:UDP-N-acetylmuramate--alanine ligase